MNLRLHSLPALFTSRGLTQAIAPIRLAALSFIARPDFGMFAVVFLLSALYRLLFVVTYPLNDLGYDAPNYLMMILNHKSSLVHAGGYPFFVNLFTFWHSPSYPPSPVFTYSLQFLQHGFELLSLAVLYFVMSDVFNKWIAALGLVFVGMDIDALTFTNMTYPEWLQADLLVLSLCVAYRGLVAGKDLTKFIYYGLSSVLFALCWLTKFNVLVFSLIFVVYYLAEKSSRKLLIALVMLLSAAAVYVLFMVSYHYPSTRYRGVTADQGWVLMSKIDWSLGKDKLKNIGINTKKLVALNEALPNDYAKQMSEVYESTDAVPSDIRKEYRDKYLWLLTANETQLDEFLRNHSLPNNFKFMYSAIPIAYYLGHDESNTLSIKVYFEMIIRNLNQYGEACFDEVQRFFVNYPDRSDGIMLPIAGMRLPLLPQGDSRQVLREDHHFGLGFVRYQHSDPMRQWQYPYASTWPVLWRPGERWFAFASRFALPSGILLLVTGLMFIYSYLVITKETFGIRSVVVLVIAGTIPAFVFFSDFTFYFRNKELRLMWPWIGTAYAIVAWWLCSLAYDAWRWGLSYAGWGGRSPGSPGKG